MTPIRTSIERRRGCGYRKPGGLYLVSGGLSEPCSALPVALEVCPTCHAGVKPTRGWTWIDPKALLALPRGPHAPAEHYDRCPLAQLDGLGFGGRAGLLWVGEKYYGTPAEFTKEAAMMGVSRRIPAVPKDFKIGTWVLLAHRKAVPDGIVPIAAPREEKMGEEAKFRPGVFHAFRPTAVEYIWKGTETEAELEAITKRGIQVVKVVPETGQIELDPTADMACPYCRRTMSNREKAEQGACNDCWREHSGRREAS